MKNSLFLKFFVLVLTFLVLLAVLLSLLIIQQSPLNNIAGIFSLVPSEILNFSSLLAVFVVIISASLIFSYLITRYYSFKLRYLKNQAMAIFEGRYTPPQNRKMGIAKDELAELSFWLDKIAQGIQTQKELLQHEAEILIKRDYRLLQTSNELKLERDKIKILLENIDEGLILLDQESKVILVNSWAEKIIAGSKEQFLGKKITDLPLNKKIKNLYLKILKNKKIIKKEIVGINPTENNEKDSIKRFFWVTIVPILPKDKMNSYCILSFRDITREKMINKMKSEFISIAAHQLRTPLSAIKWIIHMIMSGDLGRINQNQKDFLRKGYASNERMIALINDLLNVTRIEEGKFLFKFKKVSLKNLLNDLLEELIPVAARRKVKLKFIAPNIPLPRLLADEENLKLAFQNLIENAIKYSEPNKSVVIKLNKRIDSFQISIKDEGVGIPENQKGRVFSKFFRGANVIKMQTDGTGLGLFITKNIIKKHKGKIDFTSQENKGTEFIVTLPINK